MNKKELTSLNFLTPYGRMLPNGTGSFFYCSDLPDHPSRRTTIDNRSKRENLALFASKTYCSDTRENDDLVVDAI